MCIKKQVVHIWSESVFQMFQQISSQIVSL